MSKLKLKIARRKDLNNSTKLGLLNLIDKVDPDFIDKAYNDYRKLLKASQNNNLKKK